MSIFSKILAGTASVVALVASAAPAAAQQYPYGYGQNSGGILGAIINSVTGQGQQGYGQVDQRTAVAQCSAAAQQRLNGGYRNQGYGGYNGGNQNNGYQNGYGYQNVQGGARVLGITNVEPRGNGTLRVTGVASSGQLAYAQQGYNQGYGNQGYGNQGYGNVNQQADLRFTCRVDSRGRVLDVNINPLQNAYRRGY
ncbi:MAG TPA: hypothetical protein VNI79_09000 [Sphingomicrobium sp.]|nr:hypothetical protein [Sphingomicrobium sp.]